MAGEQIISMKKVCKGYKMGTEKLNALENINFEVRKGEFTAILGPSGSGKSTLMNIIGCMDTLDSGSYDLSGIPIHDAKEKELVKIRNHEIGFIFQNYHVIPTYTVMQNIIMPLLMRGMDRKSAERECEEVVDMLGLSQRVSHKPSELSGGQQQRVAIARALCSKPSLLLADEPTGALDQSSGTEVLKLFTKLHDMGNTIVMITHDLNVAKWAERTVRVVDGEIFEDEKPVEKTWNEQKQFITDASHELKTSLTVIMTNAEMLEDKGYSEADRSVLSQNILSTSKRMRGLVESLLELARMDNRTSAAEMKILDLSKLISDSILPFRLP